MPRWLTPHRHFASRLASSALIAGASFLALAGPAAAADPDRWTFAYSDTFTDDETCRADGIVITAEERVSGFVIEYRDTSGALLRATVVVDLQFDITGSNGVTLDERDRIVTDIEPDGYRQIGLWEHVNGPQGNVVIDAGQLVFDADDNLVFEPGNHDFFHGLTSFCPGFFE